MSSTEFLTALNEYRELLAACCMKYEQIRAENAELRSQLVQQSCQTETSVEQQAPQPANSGILTKLLRSIRHQGWKITINKIICKVRNM